MENIDKIVDSILLLAVRAPSGDNSQPWQIIRKSFDSIEIIDKPYEDHKIFNVNGYGSAIAQGALIENICLLSKERELLNEVSISGSSVLVNFISKGKTKDDRTNWSELINKRVTLRIPFKLDPINSKDKSDIFGEIPDNVDLFFIEDKSLINRLGLIASITEKIVLNNPVLHGMFFSIIDFSNKKDTGIQVKSMGLPKPVQFVLRLISYPKFNNIFKKINLQNNIALQNSRMYSKSGAILIYSTKLESRDLYFNFGRYLQHVWLLSTEHSIALHPITGLIYMYKYINSSFFDKMLFSNMEIEEIKSAYKEIQKIVGTNDNLVFMSRIGYIDKRKLMPLTNRRSPNI